MDAKVRIILRITNKIRQKILKELHRDNNYYLQADTYKPCGIPQN